MPSKKTEQPKKSRRPRNKWTYWFVKIIDFFLRDYDVEIISEYELYKQPMRIDVVVIKLLKNVVIDNPIMKIFRAHNIIEFKGPSDELTIEAYHKVLSYYNAYLSKNNLLPNDLTLTLVTTKYPTDLFDYLQNYCKYEKTMSEYVGIYYFRSSGFIPQMQVVVNLEAKGWDGAWLVNSLRDNWTMQDGIELVKNYEEQQTATWCRK